jgi:hypothetical protein
MTILFVYGSLLFPETWEQKLGMRFPTVLSTATIPRTQGFKRVKPPMYITRTTNPKRAQPIRGILVKLNKKQMSKVVDYERKLGFELAHTQHVPDSRVPTIHMFLHKRFIRPEKQRA